VGRASFSTRCVAPLCWSPERDRARQDAAECKAHMGSFDFILNTTYGGGCLANVSLLTWTCAVDLNWDSILDLLAKEGQLVHVVARSAPHGSQ
jgi:hypothetical protein